MRNFIKKGTTTKIASQEGGFLNFLRPLMIVGLPLIKSVLTPLAKRFLLPFWLSAVMSATDSAIKKRKKGPGITTLIILNKEMKYIMKIVKSLEESGLLIKRISETVKNETKEEKGGFIPVLLRTLAASIL